MDIAETIIRGAIGAGFLLALALNFANVIMRYVFFAPIYWAEEAMIFTFVWCVLLGASVVALKGNHLRVEILQLVLPSGIAHMLKIVVHLTAAGLMMFVAWRASTLVEMIARLQQKSIIAEIPMFVPYAAVLVGSALMSIASFICAARIISGASDEQVDPLGRVG